MCPRQRRAVHCARHRAPSHFLGNSGNLATAFKNNDLAVAKPENDWKQLTH